MLDNCILGRFSRFLLLRFDMLSGLLTWSSALLFSKFLARVNYFTGLWAVLELAFDYKRLVSGRFVFRLPFCLLNF